MEEKINLIIWGAPTILFFLYTHIFFTVKTKFIQRKTFFAIRLSVKKDDFKTGGISSFSALCSSLAGSIGTGNIVGVGMAVVSGGPGAVFWCWLTGILGMATSYAEVYLASKYKVKTKNGFRGGAMYIWEKRLKNKKAAVMFAVSAVFVSLAMGCMVQANSIARVVAKQGGVFNVSGIFAGIAIAVLTAAVIFKGADLTARVCSIVVPIMSGLYIFGCVLILCENLPWIWESVKLILKSAFTYRAAAGGFYGRGIMCAMRHGVSRGLFSNEAGLGSAPLTASASAVSNEKQALISSTAAFWDTVVMCALTGLVIVSSIVKIPSFLENANDGSLICVSAFEQIPYLGKFIIMFSIVIFAYSTILGWSFSGEVCFEYLFGEKSVYIYRAAIVGIAAVSPLVQTQKLWYVSDIFNACMAVLNLICIFILSGEVPKSDTIGKKY